MKGSGLFAGNQKEPWKQASRLYYNSFIHTRTFKPTLAVLSLRFLFQHHNHVALKWNGVGAVHFGVYSNNEKKKEKKRKSIYGINTLDGFIYQLNQPPNCWAVLNETDFKCIKTSIYHIQILLS